MRDLLPEEARRRRALARILLDQFALHGYDLVMPPAFELAEVLEKGLGTLDPGDVLRFVEPESGEVAALRPDMTPQIARMVATRLCDEPRPIRLCYEGTVLRRRQGRARRHRQIPQAGVELYGAPSPAGDGEVLRLIAAVVRAAGLSDFVIDLGHARIARALVEDLPEVIADEVTLALIQKDVSRVEAVLRGQKAVNVPSDLARALCALSDLSGGGADRPGSEVIAQGRRLFAGTKAAGPLEELAGLFEAARRGDDLGDVLRLDLGEVRGFAYYTGPIFHVLAPGPGEPIGAGGRYDDLLGRFGAPMPAVGFGLHLDALAWAREAAGVGDERVARVLVAADPPGEALVAALRARGVTAVLHAEDDDPRRYAAAFRFTHLVEKGAAGPALSGVEGNAFEPIGLPDAADSTALADAIVSLSRS
ncbi:ATP phosphoribosyltransferase regulatory subunit [Polyangium aurulentum]|uniref:ATP phosphoribosyltransferase regulatory subunit n=1 Tax=Polyangium aurulentum TaxID=2567896 RepID=UPI0010AEBD24|nr:ATP phosphoribosyltransferase regulatory subunit [Polyangium aurulentum]UQA60917.1 ATP phosphoribosyltransferase regulatory subunit [Polyangium aurulentum]